MQYIQEVVLPSNRVSAVSVGLACLTACADLVPSLTPSLSPYLSFISHNDPKLKSRSAKVCLSHSMTMYSHSTCLVCVCV